MIVNGTTYNDNTPREAIAILERYRGTARRVRVFYGDTDRPDFREVHGREPEPGKDWGEEYDVVGRIGRSGGPVAIPLIIANRRSLGGPGLLDDCIVRIMVDGRELYRHPQYHQPQYTIGQPPEAIGGENMRAAGYVAGVYADGQNVANFKSERSARRWVDFMTGKRRGK